MNILNKLTIKHLKMNKKRTIVTIIGVLLSTSLMVGIGLLLSTFREVLIEDAISNSGNYHIRISDLDKEKLSVLEKNSNVEYIYSKREIGYAETDKVYANKPYNKIVEADYNYLKSLELLKGRYPEKDGEIVIPSHLDTLAEIEYKIGDEITFYLGNRTIDGENIKTEYYLNGEEFIRNGKTVTYKVVGIVTRDKAESYSDPGFNIFTYNPNLENNIKSYIRLRKPSKTYDVADSIAEILGFKDTCPNEYRCYDEIHFNDSLISLYGASRYDNVIGGLSGVLAIMLTVVSVGCIIVIYNSFAISVMERKKQFGLFSSIGTTRSQLKKTVFFEAIIISIIGIPLGILAAYIGIGIVVLCMNNLLTGYFEVSFKLCTYPLFIIIPVIFMILTIFISAFIPANKASKVTPIEAIRQNDDIKIKGKKLRTPKIINKIFGVEGEIALKNIKRNKKKYRITVASLVISIVMFVSFSGFLDYTFKGTEEYTNVPEYDFNFNYQITEEKQKIIDKLVSHKLVEEYAITHQEYIDTDTDFTKMYSDKMKKYLENMRYEIEMLRIIVMNDEYYMDYLNKNNFKENKPILYNTFHGISYDNSSRVSKSFDRYNNNKVTIRLGERLWDDEKYKLYPDEYYPEFNLINEIDDYYVASSDNMITSLYEDSFEPVLLMSNSYYEELMDEKIEYLNVFIKTSDYNKYDKEAEEIISQSDITDLSIFNAAEEFKIIRNVVLMLEILVYGFISLVTLIGVTSVFNTINTSIHLRRREFAVLRSVGLTPKGFNKMLYFESIFVGLKSLLYGLPLSFIVIILLHLSMTNMVEFESIIIPYKSILIALIGVFIIVIITMMYSSSKIKKENILEAIREENI